MGHLFFQNGCEVRDDLGLLQVGYLGRDFVPVGSSLKVFEFDPRAVVHVWGTSGEVCLSHDVVLAGYLVIIHTRDHRRPDSAASLVGTSEVQPAASVLWLGEKKLSGFDDVDDATGLFAKSERQAHTNLGSERADERLHRSVRAKPRWTLARPAVVMAVTRSIAGSQPNCSDPARAAT